MNKPTDITYSHLKTYHPNKNISSYNNLYRRLILRNSKSK